MKKTFVSFLTLALIFSTFIPAVFAQESHEEIVVDAVITEEAPTLAYGDMILTVKKIVVGGTAVSADFTLSVNGGSPTPASFPGSESGTDVSIDAFTAYSVTESGPSNYAQSFSEGCSGESVNNFHPNTCTVTNTYVAPVVPVEPIVPVVNPTILTVYKNVVGGNAAAGDFMINVTGSSASPSSFAGNSSGTTVSLTSATAYSVSEVASVNYIATYSAGCSGTTINEFHPLVCTITNTYVAPVVPVVNPSKLTVYKNVVGGTATSSDFTINVTGGAATPNSFAGNSAGTIVSINSGSAYSVTEVAVANYTATYSADCNGTSINEFHPKTCTITNTFNGEIIGEEVVNDNTDNGRSNRRSRSRGVVLGTSTTVEPQVLGVQTVVLSDLPGLPNTGNGPLTSEKSTSVQITLMVVVMTLLLLAFNRQYLKQ
ncbi:MAG: hypothetical protein M3Q24_00265 [bacterium]|nr:hypothetical protein [bacterium]